MKFTPTIAFVLDAVPENARQIDDLLARAHATDARVAEQAAAASYAGEADPYKHDEDDDETTTNEPAESGLVILDKPAGWTSHQVVGRVRRLLGTRKVGHAGTLDPMATGVLVVGVNRATRLLGLLAPARQGVRGDDPARHRHRHRRRRGRGHRDGRGGAIDPDRLAAAIAP